MIAGVDYVIIESYIHKVLGINRWGVFTCQCLITQKFFVLTTVGVFAQVSSCSISKLYESVPNQNFRFTHKRDALRFMSHLRRFIECKSCIREKANAFILKDFHLKNPALKAIQNTWDENLDYKEDICTAHINSAIHQVLEFELTCIFNFLQEELERNSHDSYQLEQLDFFEHVIHFGGQDALNKVLDNYFLILNTPRQFRQFWIFKEEQQYTRLCVWEDSRAQRLVMSLCFLHQ